MRYRQIFAAGLLGATLIASSSTGAVAGTTEKVLWNFCTQDKCDPFFGIVPSALSMDGQGNLYGTTEQESGAHNNGTVFKLSQSGSKWAYTELYSFDGNKIGGEPFGGLIIDDAGNLYGTTSVGGSHNAGTVFELLPGAGDAKWSAKVLYNFCSVQKCKDGSTPYSGLTYAGAATGALYDGSSPLYGMTFYGPSGTCSSFGCGVAYKLTPGAKWSEQVIYSFCPKNGCADGELPVGSLLMDGSGNLFGETQGGGNAKCDDHTRCGTIFKLSSSGGKWTHTVLYRFCGKSDCSDGQLPVGNLVMDAAGALFGTTYWGGSQGFGTIFSLAFDGKAWQHRVLHSFCLKSSCSDGKLPEDGLVMDAKGNLFGTTGWGGAHGNTPGTVFEYNKSFSVLHSFCAAKNCKDGAKPQVRLILDKAGHLLGTTNAGGSKGWGTAFEIAP